MTDLLNRLARQQAKERYSVFRPASRLDYFALRLAQRLGDPMAAQHYAELADRWGEGPILAAMRAVEANSGANRALRFHAALERIRGNDSGGHVHVSRLAAIRVERRSVAMVIMGAKNPEHVRMRQLSSANNKALSSALVFVNRMFELFPFTSAAIEPVTIGADIQRGQLTAAIVSLLRGQGVSIWEIPKQELFGAFGYPPLRSRKQLRAVISLIWPMINGRYGGAFIRDAAALGLYCQTERQFINPSNP